MNFNGQPNMFFGKIISYTYDMHLKLYIWTQWTFFFGQMVKKMNPFPLSLFLKNFKTLKFLYDFI
jgi:hypothetical protein